MSKRASRTSESHPIRVDFIEPETLGLSGCLGMTIAPGMKAASAAGRWDRDLQSDLDRLRRHYDTEVLVSLMEPEELEGYRIPDLIEKARGAGIEVLHFPIADVKTPGKSESKEYAVLIGRVVELLGEGKTMVVHCRGGLGRTGTVAASVLVALGYAAREAIGEVRKARSERAVETRDQERYVERFEKEWRERYSPAKVLDRYRGSLLGLAALAACRLENFILLTSSVFSAETKLSAIALSKAVPVLPIDGVMPTSRSLSEKESAVY